MGLDAEADRYSSFAELFVHSFKRFMDTPVVVNSKEVLVEAASLSHMVSQKLVGGVTMVTGIQAENGVFLEMARRYSHEDIKEVDALAVDCLCEFLNVVKVPLGELVTRIARGEVTDAKSVCAVLLAEKVVNG